MTEQVQDSVQASEQGRPTEQTGQVQPAGPVRATDLVQALAELSGAMLATEGVEDLLARIATVAAASMGTQAWCGITLRADGRAFTVAVSDPPAAMVDEIQYANGDGPCLESLRTGTTVLVSDLTTETRWGDYPAHALVQGVRASLSLPIVVEGESVGAVNLYSPTVELFDETRRRDAAVVTAGASGTIGMALRLARQVTLSAQLEAALSSRTVIDQAIGIVIRDRRCSPDEAFAYLRSASQHRNVKLRDVATELVATMSHKPPARPAAGAPPVRPAPGPAPVTPPAGVPAPPAS